MQTVPLKSTDCTCSVPQFVMQTVPVL
jgi:hypothetical protein